MIWVSVHVSDGFPKKCLDGGWVGGVRNIQVFFWIFGICLTLQSPFERSYLLCSIEEHDLLKSVECSMLDCNIGLLITLVYVVGITRWEIPPSGNKMIVLYNQ